MDVLIRIIETQGFAILFGISVLAFVGKYAPKFLLVWTEFTKVITVNTEKTGHVDRKMAQIQERSMSVLEKLKDLNDQLEQHSTDTAEIKQNQKVMLNLLEDITKKISERGGENE